MTGLSITGVVLVIANVAASYMGFKNNAFFEGYKFDVDRVLINKDYKRLVTSGFLHLSWMHLILNCLCLLAFSEALESYMGIPAFLFIYFSALISGNLLALYIHRNHGDYSAAGASGAVCGIIFASIALFPGMKIGFFGLPLGIPSWFYGLVYVLYAIYAIRITKNDMGHEAHLGGAVVGMLLALLFRPEAIYENYWAILLIMVPCSIFIVAIVRKPELLMTSKLSFDGEPGHQYTQDERYNLERNNRQKEIDRILDKISRRGIKSLSKNEQEMLNKYSKDTV